MKQEFQQKITPGASIVHSHSVEGMNVERETEYTRSTGPALSLQTPNISPHRVMSRDLAHKPISRQKKGKEQCILCEDSFARAVTLERHMAVHHKLSSTSSS